MGSVKDLQVLTPPTKTKMGVARFIYRPDFSVFDWGIMPDPIPHKDTAVCTQAAYCMEEAEKNGMRTHYHGVVSDGKVVYLDEISEPVNAMEIDLVNVIRPTFDNGVYDYSAYQEPLVNIVIPGELIYRNNLPAGSSIFGRLEKGELSPEDLGLNHMPKPGEKLDKPFLDVSTKFEKRDRYISWKEFQNLAGLNDNEIFEIRKTLGKTNDMITKIYKRGGLNNDDGKMEDIFDSEGLLMIGDVIGTLDEIRATKDGVQISKEAARDYYRPTPWYADVVAAKKLADERKVEDWKSLCASKPKKMDTVFKEILSNMYTSTTNAITRKNFFDAPRLDDVVKAYKDYLEEHKIK